MTEASQLIVDMRTEVSLPSWLDSLIFDELGANYCRSNADMTVIDWDKTKILNYLGTYFPRSFGESYCLFSAFFSKNASRFQGKDRLSLMDFCCGTGGEIIALLLAIGKFMPWIKCVDITAIDGNHDALRVFEKVAKASEAHLPFSLSISIGPLTIRDFFDLSDFDEIITGPFDIVMTFKAICEFVSKERFEDQNPYYTVSESLLKKLNKGGIMLLVDVSSKSDVTNDWLPNMMDKGLSKFSVNKLYRNPEFNQSFYVSHSKQHRDIGSPAKFRV